MGLFDFLKDWKPKIKPEWKKKGWVDEKEFREYNFSPNMVKILEESDEEKRTGLLTWEYNATLSLITPKIYLEKHGEVLKSTTEPELFGEPTSYTSDGEPISRHGIWIQTSEFALVDGWGESIGGVPSVIGALKPESQMYKDWVNYLIDFRTIVESDLNIEEKLYQVNDVMSQSSTGYKKIYKILVTEHGFPDSFFTNLLCELDGVGGKTAEQLWDAGYLSIEAVKNAPVEELFKIKGIGKSLVNKIKKNSTTTKTNNFKKNQ